MGLQPGARSRPELVVLFGVTEIHPRPQTSSSACSSLASSVRFEPNSRAEEQAVLQE